MAFRQHFSPKLIQLVENRRCPPEVVAAANNLVTHNSDRTPGKAALVPTLPDSGPAISVRAFQNDSEEANSVANEVAGAGQATWGTTAILGRTRAILTPVLEALRSRGIPAFIATRRDRFVSPQFQWLQGCLDQAVRPTDRQMFTMVVGAANRIAGTELDAAILAAEAESEGTAYLEYWALVFQGGGDVASRLAGLALRLIQSRASWASVVSEALDWLPETTGTPDDIISDAEEDKAAWVEATRALTREKGSAPDLDELLQGIALRPKEPPADPNAVCLLTIHAAKGLEFDRVWVVGMAESILPSWQSLKADARPAELEEERRNCFVAITRTKSQLVLTHANQYRGWTRQPSRFIAEMNLVPVAQA